MELATYMYSDTEVDMVGWLGVGGKGGCVRVVR